MNVEMKELKEFNKGLLKMVLNFDTDDWVFETFVSDNDEDNKHLKYAQKELKKAVKSLWNAYESIKKVTKEPDDENVTAQFLANVLGFEGVYDED